MSFELRLGESFRKGIRRIGRKQVGEALEHLSGQNEESRDAAVHDARKSFKKVRAMLRLVRPVIGEKRYRTENDCFRDAGRPLTEVRDAKILIESLDELVEHFREHLADRSFNDTRQALLAKLRATRKRVLDEEDAFAVVAAAIWQAGARLKKWTDVPNKWWAFGKGLEDTFRRGRDAFHDSMVKPSVENLHAWRKQAKYLRYQLEILRPLWRERMEELAGEAHQMTDLLGDNHDLAVLRQVLTDESDYFGDAGTVEALLALIDRRRAELQQEAVVLGERFFQDAPRGFARQVAGYYKTWRAQADQQFNASSMTPV